MEERRISEHPTGKKKSSELVKFTLELAGPTRPRRFHHFGRAGENPIN
jgi:hypothetical protein